MSRITYFPRYANAENAVTNSTLHLFGQINQHSTERLQELLSDLVGDEEMPLGISFDQQIRSGASVPDAIIYQEPVHIVIETKVDAAVDTGQLIRHCESFKPGMKGNFLILLTCNNVSPTVLHAVVSKANTIGVVFKHITFEDLCLRLKDCAREHETHLKRVIDDFLDYCEEMKLIDRKSVV